MSVERKQFVVGMGVVVFLCASLLYFSVLGKRAEAREAQKDAQNQEVAPYKVSELPAEPGVFKLVHQGCEIFVVHDNRSWHKENSVGIALGRGCK